VRNSLVGALACQFLYSLLLSAQTPAASMQEVVIRTHAYTPPSAILHAESNLVETPLTVRDSLGRTVAGLHASDFEVLDNGVPRQVVAFSELRSDGRTTAPASGTAPSVDAPASEARFVTFFFDDLHTGPPGLLFVKRAAHAFIDKGLKPSDWMAIVTASGESDLDFTNDAKLFSGKLDRLRSHAAAITWEQYQAQSLDIIAALRFAAKRLSEMHGTRTLLLISRGIFLRPEQTEFESLMDAAARWNVVVHAFDAKGLDTTPSSLSPQQYIAYDNARWFSGLPLERIAQRTGGHFFKGDNDFAGDLERAANPEVTYLLAFSPGGSDGKFHKLKIRFKSKRGDGVEFRPGYFSRPDESEKALSARAPLDDAVFSNQTLHDVPATVALAGGRPKDGTKAGMFPVSIGITVDLNRLQFTTANGRHMQQIVFLMTLLDANGNFVTGKESIMDLALTEEKLASLKKDGLKTIATLNAPAGIYQVRTIVREGMKGGLTASTTAVELRAK
jgi:VWFA-related protein